MLCVSVRTNDVAATTERVPRTKQSARAREYLSHHKRGEIQLHYVQIVTGICKYYNQLLINQFNIRLHTQKTHWFDEVGLISDESLISRTPLLQTVPNLI